jgi:hypothetical protein
VIVVAVDKVENHKALLTNDSLTVCVTLGVGACAFNVQALRNTADQKLYSLAFITQAFVLATVVHLELSEDIQLKWILKDNRRRPSLIVTASYNTCAYRV